MEARPLPWEAKCLAHLGSQALPIPELDMEPEMVGEGWREPKAMNNGTSETPHQQCLCLPGTDGSHL